MKILTVVGARPQFIKAAVVSRRLLERDGVQEVLVHTGQHYDARMSQVFFDAMGIPRPTHNLAVGSGGHGVQTGRMLAALETVLQAERPDRVLVYGDTNSTLAGALAAAKLHVPVAHVEAGMRSFNRRMPEEVNRVVTDHLAELHLCATRTAVENLRREGVENGVHWVGDVMLDAVQLFATAAEGAAAQVLHDLPPRYGLVTCHRAENTDDPERLAAIVGALSGLAGDLPLVFPVHPRTRAALDRAGLQFSSGVRALEPVGYLELLDLQRNAAVVITDSGGVQKEAFFLGVRCVTLRAETEWVETVEQGWNRLTGAAQEMIVGAVRSALGERPAQPPDLTPFGGGTAAQVVAGHLAGTGA